MVTERSTGEPLKSADPAGEFIAADRCAGKWKTLCLCVQAVALVKFEKTLERQCAWADDVFAQCCVRVKCMVAPRKLRGRFAQRTIRGWDGVNSRYFGDTKNLAKLFQRYTPMEGCIPIIYVDDIVGSDGVTVARRYDRSYRGPAGIIIEGDRNTSFDKTLAHELLHVAGFDHGDAGADRSRVIHAQDRDTDRKLIRRECRALRRLAV